MQTATKAAQMSLPGGTYGRTFHPSIVGHSLPAKIERPHVPSWSDMSSHSDRTTLTCYESMITVRKTNEYFQNREDAAYFRSVVGIIVQVF